jgi:heme oxygenase
MTPLKEATAEKHKRAERMPFNIRMFRGQLAKEEYLLHLYQQAAIFKAIEAKGLPHPDLQRYERVCEDIAELAHEGAPTENILPATGAYVDYLTGLTYQEILPHIYLNYLALMYGGQMMKKVVPSTGKMFDFENMPQALESVRAVQQDSWADEVNKGFDYIIGIFDALENASINA